MIPHTLNLLKHTNIWLKLSSFKFKMTYPRTYYRQREAMERYKQCRDKKPSYLIRKEIQLSKKFWGCFPLFYFRYDLFRAEAQLTEEELLEYIPEFFYVRILLDPYYANKFALLTIEKIITQITFKSLDIPQAQSLGNLIHGVAYNEEMEPLQPDRLIDQIKNKGHETVFIKPSNGKCGRGIFKFNFHDKEYLLANGTPLTEGFIKSISMKDNYHIEAGINQDKAIQQIYPGSINTFRIVTENLNGNPKILGTVLRIGHGGSFVDNFSQDGLALGIDQETGAVRDYAITERMKKYYSHPDTNFKFTGFVIPEWNQIKQFALTGSKKLGLLPYIGWDIGLTDSGPIAIEANIGLGTDLTQVPLNGLRRRYRIEDPQEYWKRSPKYRVEQYEKYAL